MLSVERINTIKQLLIKYESVSIPELSKQFCVSGETIRRDIDKICAEDSRVIKVYGGAYRAKSNQDPPYMIRKASMVDEKKHIAANAMRFINDNDTIMLDSSTTALVLSNMIAESQLNLTVITNSLSIVNELCECPNICIVNIGGSFDINSRSFCGNITLSSLKNYHADSAFISCSGLSCNFGATDSSEEAALIRRAMISNSSCSILLVDSNKFGRCKTNRIADIDQFTAIITNKMPDEEWFSLCAKHNISLNVTDS